MKWPMHEEDTKSKNLHVSDKRELKFMKPKSQK